jgi:hypothetical protein
MLKESRDATNRRQQESSLTGMIRSHLKANHAAVRHDIQVKFTKTKIYVRKKMGRKEKCKNLGDQKIGAVHLYK